MRCKTAHFAVRNGPFGLVKWAESQCETGRIAFLYWPSRMLVLTEPCRGVARTVLHNAKQRKFISSQYAANHYFAVRAFFINFASDKLRLGNWSKLHCSRLALSVHAIKLRLGNPMAALTALGGSARAAK